MLSLSQKPYHVVLLQKPYHVVFVAKALNVVALLACALNSFYFLQPPK